MQDLIAIFTSPGSVFRSQKEDSSWWMPAVIVVILSAISVVAVLSSVDTQVMVEAQLNALAEQGVPQAQIDGMRQQFDQGGEMMQITQIGGGIFGAVVFYFVLLLLHSLYYLIVGKIVGSDMGFSDWIALFAWAKMPLAVLAIFTILVSLFMSGSASPNDLYLLSLAYWLPMPNETGGFGSDFVWSLDLIVFWCIALFAIGFKEWTDKSMGVSLAIAALPYIVFYGLVSFI